MTPARQDQPVGIGVQVADRAIGGRQHVSRPHAAPEQYARADEQRGERIAPTAWAKRVDDHCAHAELSRRLGVVVLEYAQPAAAVEQQHRGPEPLGPDHLHERLQLFPATGQRVHCPINA